MSDYIRTRQNGNRIDQDLKAILDAQNADNNGLILYIRNGQIAFDTEENLFTITELE